MVPTGSHRASPTPWYSGYPYSHKPYLYGTITPYGVSFQILQVQFMLHVGSYNPRLAVTNLVWTVPRSLATTCGITIVFFSSGYLDVSVLRVSSLIGWYHFMVPGCPIQKSADQRLFAPPHSLSQLITSFFASKSLGILHTPLITFLSEQIAPLWRYLFSSNMSKNFFNWKLTMSQFFFN